MQFKDAEGFRDTLRFLGISAVHEMCSLYNATAFQAQRGSIQETLKTQLQSRYTPLWVSVTDLQVKDIRRPSEYEAAIRTKEEARQNIEVARQERTREVTQANTRLLSASQQAKITVAKAQSDARIVLAAAARDVQAIEQRYIKQAEMYQRVKSDLSLDTKGLLSYIGIRTVSNAANPVYIGLKAPAKSSYAPL